MDAIPSIIYLILALGAFAVAGGLLVWVTGYIRGKSKENSKERERSPTSVTPAEPGTIAPAGERELLRISRTKKDDLAIFVQGQRYRHLREIKDPQVGRETIEALKVMLAFSEGWLPTSRQAPPQPEPAAQKSTVDEEAFLERLRRSDLFSVGSPARSSQPAPLIPVKRINDLVQERLRERPDLAGRNIHLTTGVDGTLLIYVAQQTFDAVGDIPDPQVRALIQDAIREWECG
jgi:hypothetical protein